jgi:2,3-bisphosphoglycerate-independent phosphoglycerate mutase
MKLVDRRYDPEDPGADIRARLAAAEQLLGEADFVHVHVKAPAEAGHTKNPAFKQAVIEALDRGLASLPDLAQRCVVAVTGDHASPSVGGLLHSGDPTPLVIAAPGLRADHIVSCGERSALQGELGRVRAADILPLLAGYANRPIFRGHRPGARSSCALPAAPEPMPIRH